LNAYISHDTAATDLREGVSFNSSSLHKSCLNLTVKKVMKIGFCRSYIKNKCGLLFSETRVEQPNSAGAYF